MKIVIIGSGMYVTGKGMSPTGTILSSVLQSSIDIDISEVHIISQSEASRTTTLESAANSNMLLGTDINVLFHSIESNGDAWLDLFLTTQKFDAGIVSVPDHLHYYYSHKLISANIHCLVVKPLTPTLEEANNLIGLAEAHAVYGAVEFHKRWDESNLYLKASIDHGKLGELLYFDVNYSQKISIPAQQFKSWAHKTNIFQYLGVHYVDLIYFITGARPIEISVFGTKKKLIDLGIDTFDSVHVSSIWSNNNSKENQFYVHFNLNWIDSRNTTAMSDQRISVIGTEGRIDCDQKNRGIYEVTNSNGAQSINPYFSQWIAADDGKLKLNGYGYKSINGFIMDVNALLNSEVSLQDLNNNRPSFKECLVSTQFIEIVNELLYSGERTKKLV